MAPRKVSDTEPRRSGRIAALPAAAAPVEAQKPKAAKAKATKKRAAEDVDDAKEGETSVAKKVRAGFLFSCTNSLWLIEPFFFNKAKAEEEEEEGDADAAALPKIELGGSLPSVTLKNEKGEDIQVADLAAEKGVILFLVPKADTRMSFFVLVYRCF
jgi:peroxiredoxin Q/BCP